MIQGLITSGAILALLLLAAFSIQLIISRKRLKKSNATKDKLFSIIAHDLRAPFTGLIGLSEILVEQSADEPDTTRRTIAQNLHGAAEEAYGLLQNLLMWSQSQNKNLAISPEPIELNEIVAEAIRLLQLHASEKNIRFHTEMPDNLTVVSDRNMIQSIIRNLLGNAVKFSHPGGAVDLAIQRGNGGITLQIRDRGIGMTPDRVKQIFKTGLTSTRGTRNEGGSGLGLVICRDFIRRLKGTLHVTSAPGEGSVFTIFIPETEATTTES
jgi:signal transduction histidine kinase